ncbi:APC family permease [Thermomonospora umbrina]|uniref:Amino acid/polyamine/organocation transporter (APC superfamily) n=1 Tax=Thermomonospora umbrina TaxID=111806 RepID=A0A3D9SIQ3_9ACTN|nr:APC family permease [Thermomonospora umbrina]REE95796.1 amino acid/polyamine/organocation transporter (APC superfamily) [Thermomonospora umbrina]
MTVEAERSGTAEGLGRTLGTPKIVFLVVAAAAPLVAMAGTVPLSMGSGNGAGVPGTYLVATVTLILFSVGYAAMARRITDRGGFYAYIARGLGRPVAAAGAVFALVGYNALVAALAGGIGYFLTDGAEAPGPWWAYSAVAIVIMGVLGYRNVDLSARLLAVLMTCEVVVLLVFDVAVLAERGTDAFVAASFDPGTVLAGAPGVAFMFAFGSFAGYESAALYAEETKDPKRAVPRATYAAVLVIGLFYTLTSWLTVGAIGADEARQAAKTQEGDLFFNLTEDLLGAGVRAVFGLLVITSIYAALVSSHNASGRYLFSLARDELAPARLGRVHPRHRSPHTASLAQTAFTALVVAIFAVAGLDPYTNLVTIMSGLSTLGIVLLQAFASIAIVRYFRRDRSGTVLKTLVAPLAGCVGLLAGAVLLLANFATLAHSDALPILALPYVVIALAAAAALYAYRLRGTDPERYARIGHPTSVEAATREEDTDDVHAG